MYYPGDITAVHGIRVGQAHNERAKTGVTVVLAPRDGAVGGVSVRGAAPGTRETDVLRPGNLVERAHAVVLAGGSVFGLAAADGVVRFLAQQGVGMDMGIARVAIVPAAVLFDLAEGEGGSYPDAAMGRAACTNAAKGISQGRYGAGAGCTVGKLLVSGVPRPGGIGSASLTLPEGVTVGAVVAVNDMGDVTLAASSPAPHADGTSAQAENLPGAAWRPSRCASQHGSNTTIGAVADSKLSPAQANRPAAPGDGPRPSGIPRWTVILALATERVDAEVNFVKLCAAAAEVTARAVANAIYYAKA